MIIPKRDDDFNDDEEKMKCEFIRRLDNMLLQKQFFLEPAEVIPHNKFQRLNSGLPNDQEKSEWDMHWLNPSFHCVFFYWRQKEIQELMRKYHYDVLLVFRLIWFFKIKVIRFENHPKILGAN